MGKEKTALMGGVLLNDEFRYDLGGRYKGMAVLSGSPLS
jgi:hypothetical protein